MGLVAGKSRPHAAVQVFLGWDCDTLDAFIQFIRDCTATSLRMTKWNMLEFVGTERLEEVSAFFSVFDESGQDTCINGLHVGVVLLLCNPNKDLRAKFANCLQLFDWNGQESLSLPDVVMLLRVCCAALSRCCGCPFETVLVRELCDRAIPNGQSASCSELLAWALEEDIARFLPSVENVDLSVYQQQQGGDSCFSAGTSRNTSALRVNEISDCGASALNSEISVLAIEGQNGDEAEDTNENAVIEQRRTQSAAENDSAEASERALGLGNGRDATESIAGRTSAAEGECATNPLGDMVVDDVIDTTGGVNDVASSRNIAQVVEHFVHTVCSSLSEQASLVESMSTGRSFPSPAAGELEYPWKFAHGFLLPLAFTSGAFAIGSFGEPTGFVGGEVAGGSSEGQSSRSSRGSAEMIAVALRHRVWLRHGRLHEEIRFCTALATRRLAATPHPVTVKEARLRAADQLAAVLDRFASTRTVSVASHRTTTDCANADDVEQTWQAALADCLQSAEENCLSALQEIAVLIISFEQPSAVLRRDLARLDGATAFLEILRLQGERGGLTEVEKIQSSIRALQRKLSTELASLDPLRSRLDVSMLEFLSSQELILAHDSVHGVKGDRRLAVQRCCEDLRGVSGVGAGASVDAGAIADAYEVQERRWRLCEGAIAAQRSLLSGGSSLRLEMWLQQARQEIRMCMRCKTMCQALSAADANQAARAQKLAFGTVGEVTNPQTRRRVLAALYSALLGIRSQNVAEDTDAENFTELQSSLTATLLDGIGSELAAKEQSPSQLEETNETVEGASDATAHFRNLKFQHRCIVSAVAVLRALSQDTLQDKLVDRLVADLDQSSEVLNAVQQSEAFRQRRYRKWTRIVEEEMVSMTASCRCLDDGIKYVRKRLCNLHMLLLGIDDASSTADGTEVTQAYTGVSAPLLTEAIVHLEPGSTSHEASSDLRSAGPLCASVARHAHLARTVGALWALELSRENAGSSEIGATAFALLKKCIMMKVDARMLEVSAEQRMLDAVRELRSSRQTVLGDTADEHEGTAVAVAHGNGHVDNSPNDIINIAESLFKSCFRTDFSHLLQLCGEDANFEFSASWIARMSATMESSDEPQGEDVLPEPPPVVPALSSWWRADGGEPPAPFDTTCCPRCLAVSSLACKLHSPGLSGTDLIADCLRRHAIALRVWIWSRAQRAFVTALLRGSTLHIAMSVHLKRTSLRFIEILRRDALIPNYLADHSEVRCTALRSAQAFLSPLTASDLDVLQPQDVALHVDEVRGSLGRALSSDLDDHLRRLTKHFDSLPKEASMEEGIEASVAALRELGVVVDSTATAHIAKPLLRDGSMSTDKAGSPRSQRSFKASEPYLPYIAQLCGTLHGLDLLEVASSHVA
eukprot:TRINITY_DN34373_c0_g1_i1.p1 TRINITY_DN34373_c0_g1~~TRINITY_DN34373_c0_g1_i1.p1  ORF type:complete len:1384 (+),score=173.57 TRINITY_DN34373_c0_g1_i1:68-4219(+)